LTRLEKLEKENDALRALHEAGLSLHGELSRSAVLQRVVDTACSLLGADYGALSLVDEDGAIVEFHTSGIDDEQRQKIGAPPRGAGLLAVPLIEGHALRLSDLTKDPRSTGFPEHHPTMRSLLAVPIICKSPYKGNLYLADAERTERFDEESQKTLQRFALEAAVAIDTAHVHHRLESMAIVEERLRISREMHDGIAQVLAYVSTKAQAAREYLVRGKGEQALEQIEQLAAAGRDVYTEVRESILALRLQPGPNRRLKEALEEFADLWERRGGTRATVTIDDGIDLTPKAQLQLSRIVQEALSNIRKHARANRAQVEIVQQNGEVVATVVDDGRGFDASLLDAKSTTRFGLSVMRERAEDIGGTFSIETEPGKGTRIRVTVPLAPHDVRGPGGTTDASTHS
jgi:signal transduction histidine kinase